MADLGVLLPILTLGVGALVVHLAGRLVSSRNGFLAGLTAGVYALALVAVARLVPLASAGSQAVWPAGDGAPAMLRAEPGAVLLGLTGLALGLAVAIYSGRYLEHDQRHPTYYPLLLLLSCGALSMPFACDLFVLYLSAVLSGAASYVLVAFRRHTETAVEAGFKYVVMGSAAAVLVLLGIGFLYRAEGTLSLASLGTAPSAWRGLGIGLVCAGLAIKGAVVPAHTWLPDAHGRAPSSVSALLSGILIETNVYVMVKVGLLAGWSPAWLGALLVALAVANMTVGNLMALRQAYGKRLLAYSSVAQVGYMLLGAGLGIATGRPEPLVASLYLLVAHAGMKGLAFLAKGACHHYCEATLIRDLDGMHRRLPGAATLLVLALAGLAGVPPLAGFVAKWQLLVGALRGAAPWVLLALAALVANTLLGLGYYLPLIGRILRPGGAPPGVRPMAMSHWMLVPGVALGAAVALLSLSPRPVLALAREAALYLLAGGG